MFIDGTGIYEGTYGPGETIPDANCEANGGLLSGGFIPSLGGQKCGFLYGPRFNLVNEEERTNLYAAVTHEMDNGVTVRGELGFAKNEYWIIHSLRLIQTFLSRLFSRDRLAALSMALFVGTVVRSVRKRPRLSHRVTLRH